MTGAGTEPQGPLVIIVEDDAAIAEGLALNLRLQGYRTEGGRRRRDPPRNASKKDGRFWSCSTSRCPNRVASGFSNDCVK